MLVKLYCLDLEYKILDKLDKKMYYFKYVIKFRYLVIRIFEDLLYMIDFCIDICIVVKVDNFIIYIIICIIWIFINIVYVGW